MNTASWSDYATGAFGGVSSSFASFGSDSGASYVLPIIVTIIVIALITIVVFVALRIGAARPKMTLVGPVDLFKPVNPVAVGRGQTRSLMNASYTLAFYVNIAAVPDMRQGATPLLTWPGVWNLQYNAAKEEADWLFYETIDNNSGAAAAATPVSVPSVPLQRWTQLVITVAGRTVDLYVNGKLTLSKLLDNVTPSSNSSITIVPSGIMGQLAYVQVWPRRLTVGEVAANYTDTSDSQGRPYFGPDFLKAITNISTPNLFCSSGNCDSKTATANESQVWDFPYA
jgi:hypothetical protein